MFCFQCQEAAKSTGCTTRGVCGKTAETAGMQDLAIYILKGIALTGEAGDPEEKELNEIGRFITQVLFATITNANFQTQDFTEYVEKGIAFRDSLKKRFDIDTSGMHDSVTWKGNRESFEDKAGEVGVLACDNEDIRSLRELAVYGMKGLSAYAHHAEVLGYEDPVIYRFLIKGLSATTRDLSVDELKSLVLETGETAVTTMALLDRANTETYGNPEITEVNIGVRNNPGILISGHDLKDMEELLEQTEGTGIDVYTHSEMLPANYYPAFKKYDHFVGNYGNAWWKQNEEFEAFGGPVLMTTNCITPVKDSYKDRIFTTGVAGYPEVKHIEDRPDGGKKDFSELIEMAKGCNSPKELEKGSIVGGFAHEQVMKLADKVVEAVQSGAIKKFVVMAGCDGRHKSREYYTEVAKTLPEDTVILTAGCAKFRYNKLPLGDIGGIPRVLDAGQCNDSYSLAVIALKLKEVFGFDDVNELPIAYDIAWYEQKAVAVLLALLSLGVKHIRLGPTLPAFLSPNVTSVLVDLFDLKPIEDAESDVAEMVG
ncbi:MAG: hydroxylamine reductase [Spirochaetales bacterium]|nr:hydroxylamine reductase [Spirochaetales bacterium]MCF7938068.1 hydroxylamine reductase [Spirochaetales bacterium]